MRTATRIAILLALVGLFGASACSSLPTKTPPPAHTVFVEAAQIIKDEERPGWYRVTEGWLAERLYYEQRLQRGLEACQEELYDE